jgi:hypothetical protein
VSNAITVVSLSIVNSVTAFFGTVENIEDLPETVVSTGHGGGA